MLAADEKRGMPTHPGRPLTGSSTQGRSPSAHRRRARSRIRRCICRLGELLLVLVALGVCAGMVAIPGSARLRGDAEHNKLHLDKEIQRARTDVGIPDTLLAPILNAERQVTAGRSWNANDQMAAGMYAQLAVQLHAIEQTSTVVLRDKTQGDLGFFTDALAQDRSEGFEEISSYQARLDTALERFSSARTTADFASVDAFVQAQTGALQSLWPAYRRFQAFRAVLRSLRLAGIPSALGEHLYQRDRDAFQEASPPGRYAQLAMSIDGQMAQVEADVASALAANAPALLRAFVGRVGLLRSNGEAASAATLQTLYDEDMRLLSPTGTAATPDYLALAHTLDGQTQALALPLLRAETRRQIQTLAQLVAHAQTNGTLDPYNGRMYPAAYEYADAKTGYGALLKRLHAAQTIDSVQAVADDAGVMTTNLHALLENLHDATPPSRQHRADLHLLAAYHLAQGRVIVVSLREQTARIYENGALVRWSYVTTGRIELPSPPGIHVAMTKSSPVLFISPEPRNSPFWFAPTPVNYAIQYADGGDFIHDAPWRSGFGPGTNLPHYDPIAFNGGSHGCINFPEGTMRWLYDWTPVGTPVIVY